MVRINCIYCNYEFEAKEYRPLDKENFFEDYEAGEYQEECPKCGGKFDK